MVLTGVVLLLLVVDQGARLVAEGQLAARAREAATDPGSVDASITSFPFIGRLLAAGSVPRVSIRVDDSRAGPVRLAAVVVEADGVELDRGAMFSGEVRVQAIDRGLVAVELDANGLTDALKVPVTVGDGQVRVGVRGVGVRAEVQVKEGVLGLRVAGLSALEVAIVRTPLIPCAATSVVVAGDRVRLSCELDELPAVLRK